MLHLRECFEIACVRVCCMCVCVYESEAKGSKKLWSLSQHFLAKQVFLSKPQASV